jgi:pimeloyl-ACP methyl ester carboxylesterase
MQLVPSTDGVTLAVHDLGGRGPVLLCSHATGFHGHVWQPMAELLADRFHVLAVDYRGHGHSTAPASGSFSWEGFGDDATAVVEALDLRGCVGVGHSMGGAALVMAELARPGSFAALALFEPILIPRDPNRAAAPMMALAARRRRPQFPSKDAALENFAGKPPLNVLTPAALAAYVEWGFADAAEGGAVLRCQPETEARTYEGAPEHGTFERLGELTCPTLVLAGKEEPMQPSSFARMVADAIPMGSFEQQTSVGHFGPMEDPNLLADRFATYFSRALPAV